MRLTRVQRRHGPIKRLRALATASALVAAYLVTAAAVTVAAPAPSAHADTATADPLLLIHGFNDDCGSAWNTNSNRPGDQAAATYLSGAGFGTPDEVGYYTSSAASTDSLDTSTCTEDLNSLVSTDQNMQKCNNLPGPSSAYGTKDDQIDRLACLLAWYIWDKYSQYGRTVNVLAHSMGGLIIRDAIGRTSAHAQYFPPQPLWVARVVTVATPHGGIGGLYRTAAASNSNTNGAELDDMQPGSAFMNMVGGFQEPQGQGGTYWALMGASDGPYTAPGCPPEPGEPYGGGNIASCYLGDGDGIVPTDSQMSMQAGYKIVYGVQLGQQVCDSSGNCTFLMNPADWNTQYEHETGIPCQNLPVVGMACFNGPFYLNDAGSGGTSAWVCASSCNDTSIPGGNPVSVSRSLATIVSQLNHPMTTPTLPSYPFVLRSWSSGNGNFVSAELGYTGSSYGMLRARASTQGPWETWTEVVLPNGNVAFRSNANGMYVSEEDGYTGSTYGELRARASVVGPWENFQTAFNPDGTYSIKSVQNGLYVSAELGYTGSNYAMLRARATSVGPWETFTTRTGSLGCTDYGGTLMTGPNACVGFHTAPPPGQPASGNVWFSGGGVGLFGQETWTYANGTTATSTAVYDLSGMDTTHAWQLQAYIPNDHSSASHAHYHYCSPGGGCADGYVNQNNYTNQWAAFGAVCTTDGTAEITLADDGGDSYPAQVGADAIRAVRTGIAC